jgi:hypothetical protein
MTSKWPPPAGTSPQERTRLWKEYNVSTPVVKPVPCSSGNPKGESPDPWWKASEYYDDWIFKRVRLVKDYVAHCENTFGVVNSSLKTR